MYTSSFVMQLHELFLYCILKLQNLVSLRFFIGHQVNLLAGFMGAVEEMCCYVVYHVEHLDIAYSWSITPAAAKQIALSNKAVMFLMFFSLFNCLLLTS